MTGEEVRRERVESDFFGVLAALRTGPRERVNMSVHLVRDLAALHEDLLQMGSRVGDAIHHGVDALGHPDPAVLKELMRNDDDIDRDDVQIEEACLKMLALHQPVASDLRRITSILRISTELERIADLGVNIAERAAALAELPPIPVPPQLADMCRKALDMLDSSVAAYISLDQNLAREVCAADEAVDDLNRQIIGQLEQQMQAQPACVPAAMHLFGATRNIERVADHATNVAEVVIYLVEGDIVRHKPDLRMHKHSA